VESLKLIQIGLTLSDADGNFPEDITTWQFNLNFDRNKDLSSEESICLLENAGIDFERLQHSGIPNESFAESLIPSGLILNEHVNWVTFHGIYDFAYLLRLVTNLPLPNDENAFYSSLETYFPNYYDTRHLINNYSWLKGNLNKIASDLDVQRIGATHQAGSDSLITSKLFYRIAEQFPEIDFVNERNKVYGLGNLFGGNDNNLGNPLNKVPNKFVSNNYPFYTNNPNNVNMNVVNNLENVFPSKFNTSSNVSMTNHQSPSTIYQGASIPYYNNQQYYQINKQQQVTNNSSVYPNSNMMYYNNNISSVNNNYIMSTNNNLNSKKLGNVYPNEYTINSIGAGQNMKNSNISQFYPNMSNNIATI